MLWVLVYMSPLHRATGRRKKRKQHKLDPSIFQICSFAAIVPYGSRLCTRYLLTGTLLDETDYSLHWVVGWGDAKRGVSAMKFSTARYTRASCRAKLTGEKKRWINQKLQKKLGKCTTWTKADWKLRMWQTDRNWNRFFLWMEWYTGFRSCLIVTIVRYWKRL